jgi:hypothetical protein
VYSNLLAEDFYKNDYPDEESNVGEDIDNSDLDFDDGVIDRLAPVSIADLREGEEYTEKLWNEDDDEGGDYSDDNFDKSTNAHSPKEHIWSEDENYEEYRNRILGNLEKSLQ